MDLNEKIAARRRELVVEQEKARQAEKEVSAKLAAERSEAIGVEVNKRLAEQGIELPNSLITPKGTIDKKSIDEAVEKALDKAATARMTSGENAIILILAVLGFLFLFISWPVGVALIIWAVFYMNGKTKKYKEQILDEGYAKIKLR